MVMLTVRGLRDRWAAFCGAFGALALGVALTAAVGQALAAVVGGGPAERTAADREAVVVLVSVLGTAAGVTLFTSAFAVASTFALGVALRRRELGLLRTVGVTPRQVRAAVLGEALVVGVAASAAGCVLGDRGAPWLAAWMRGVGLAPEWFAVGGAEWPFHAAFWAGLAAAFGGAVAAAVRAAGVPAEEALREAESEAECGSERAVTAGAEWRSRWRRVPGSGAMTAGRWVLGTVAAVWWLVATGAALATDPGELLRRKTYTVQPMLLVCAVGMLAPVLVGPVVRLAGRVPGPLGMLARANAAAGVRRSAVVAAPVLVAVAVAGSLLGSMDAVAAGKAAEERQRSLAALAVRGGDAALVRELGALPGVRAAVPVREGDLRYREADGTWVRSAVRAVEPGRLAEVAELPLESGSPAALDGGSIVVNREWGGRLRPGDRVRVEIGGERRSLRVAAVMRTGTGDNGAYVVPGSLPRGSAGSVRTELRLEPGASPSAVSAAVARLGAEVVPAVAEPSPEQSRLKRLGAVLVLGLAVLYSVICLANGLAMSTAARGRELGGLSLLGLTRGQLLRLVLLEALLVTAAGALLGLLVTAAHLASLVGALALLAGPSAALAAAVFPWAAVLAVVGVCAAAAVLASGAVYLAKGRR